MRRKLRAVTPLVVALALIAPATAAAGPLAPLGIIVGTYEDSGSRSFSTLGGMATAFQMYTTNISSQSNTQAVQGQFGGATFVGLLVAHTYDHPTDHPQWTLTGT